MDQLLTEIDASTNVAHTLDLLRREAFSLGVRRFSYHFTEAHHSQTGSDVDVVAHGFEPEWIELYDLHSFRKHDPIPDFVMESGRTMSWREILDQLNLDDAGRRYVEAMQVHHLEHGISIPLFGPAGLDAYSCYSWPMDLNEVGGVVIRRLESVAQFAHRHISTLMLRDRKPSVTLSAREREVLHWVVQGKSQTDIGTIIGVSPATIDTYVRRIFQKLDTTNRVTAGVKALSLGLVRL